MVGSFMYCLTWTYSWRSRCIVRQCVAACCIVLQYVAVCCSMLQYVAVCCSVLQCVALVMWSIQLCVCCAVLQWIVAVVLWDSMLQLVAVCCSCFCVRVAVVSFTLPSYKSKTAGCCSSYYLLVMKILWWESCWWEVPHLGDENLATATRAHTIQLQHATTMSSSGDIHTATTTGIRRCVGCLKSQVPFHKRATNYRALLRKMTCENKAFYESLPPCSIIRISNSLQFYCIVEICTHMYEYL